MALCDASKAIHIRINRRRLEFEFYINLAVCARYLRGASMVDSFAYVKKNFAGSVIFERVDLKEIG